MFPPAWKNFGGVKTDIRCRVRGKLLEPVRGLYAAGEFAGTAGGAGGRHNGGFVVRRNRG